MISNDYENEIKNIRLLSEHKKTFELLVTRIKESMKKDKSLKDYCNYINVWLIKYDI